MIWLCEAGFDLEQEDDVAGFLAVRIEQNEPALLEMKQEGLIDHLIEVLILDVGSVNGEGTPAGAKSLVKDEDGEVTHSYFIYSIALDALLYLPGQS